MVATLNGRNLVVRSEGNWACEQNLLLLTYEKRSEYGVNPESQSRPMRPAYVKNALGIAQR